MMTKRSTKLLPVWLAISCVLIIAGLVLSILLGFNTSADKPQNKSVEVNYDVLVEIAEDASEKIETACRKAFTDNGLKVTGFETVKEVQTNNGSKTGNGQLRFTFASTASDSALASAKTAAESAIAALQIGGDPEITVSVHTNNALFDAKPVWRGAIALGVGVVVVLSYAAVRFGLGMALTGLTVCVHDSLLTLAIFAVARIPVYTFAPLLYAAVAATCSLLLWLVQCMKMRENFKEPEYSGLNAEEAVTASAKSARKVLVGVLCALAVVVAVSGGLATAGVRMFLLPALIPVAVVAYSTFLFAPALHVKVKGGFDKAKAKRTKTYSGKKKSVKTEE